MQIRTSTTNLTRVTDAQTASKGIQNRESKKKKWTQANLVSRKKCSKWGGPRTELPTEKSWVPASPLLVQGILIPWQGVRAPPLQQYAHPKWKGKIQVLRHFQHFPASACASKRAFLQLREEQNPSIFDQKLVGISRKEQKSEQDHPELIRNTAYYYSEVV